MTDVEIAGLTVTEDDVLLSQWGHVVTDVEMPTQSWYYRTDEPRRPRVVSMGPRRDRRGNDCVCDLDNAIISNGATS